MLKGIDFSFGGGITPAQIKAAGYAFAGRYLTGLDGNPKDMTAAELHACLEAHLPVILVFETDGQEFTQAQGASDARAAQAQLDAIAAAIKHPALRDATVFFAQDLPESAGVDPVAYQRGACSVLGVKRTGIYGRYATVKACFDAGVTAYGWQTSGGSGGQWDNRSLLRQVAYDVKVGPASCDVDEAAFWSAATPVLGPDDDFGQFPRPAKGPFRHVLQGRSLRQVAEERRTTVQHLMDITIKAYTDADLAQLADATMHDAPFYTSNP